MSQEDDVYPNDGTYFMPREPEDQDIARKQEKAKTLQGLSVLKEVVARLEARIEFFHSLDAIPAQEKTNPERFMTRHNANEMARNSLIEEKEFIEGLLDVHAPNR